MNRIVITEKLVTDILQSLNGNKAFGSDEFPPRILKKCALVLAPPLTTLFVKSLESGSLPKDWKMATVIVIFKKGEKLILEIIGQ